MSKNKRPILTFLVFLILSTALWLLIKLSESYTTQTMFRVVLTDAPADKWIVSPEQTVKFSMDIDGFHTLKHDMIRDAKREVSIPLIDVPYRHENGSTYSFSSQYVTEQIADFLNINASDITMNEAKVYFNMEPLKSKVVPVRLRSDIKTQRQYGVYGIPILDPSSVTVYGPEETIDTLKSVQTVLVTKNNVGQEFSEMVALDLPEGKIQSNTKSVKVTINVVKFTETDIKVPISTPDSLKLRLFPEEMTVKCLVAIKDYASMTPENFRVVPDMEQLKARQHLLDLHLVKWPQYIQVLETSPDKVEYIIVQ